MSKLTDYIKGVSQPKGRNYAWAFLRHRRGSAKMPFWKVYGITFATACKIASDIDFLLSQEAKRVRRS